MLTNPELLSKYQESVKQRGKMFDFQESIKKIEKILDNALIGEER